MRTVIIAASFAAVGLVCSAAAEDQQPPPAPTEQPAAVPVRAPDDSQKACHYVHHEGSLLRICSSERESASVRQDTRRNIREYQQRSMQASPPR